MKNSQVFALLLFAISANAQFALEGYVFETNNRGYPGHVVDAIQGATIEIYNRTTRQPVFVLQDAPDAFFQYTFERDNHYTMLIRKEGFLSKRVEVYVNVNGCIICVDGVRDVSPGVVDNLTAGNNEGTLLANIELDRARLDNRIQIQNIYDDFDKWDIRPDAAECLDHVVTLMKDNPGISVELGSHTDSRGNDEYNRTLSQYRAAAAVAYIVSEGIDSSRITAKGYGESQLVNRCRNGVECSEEEHQQNRRTELRITGITEKMTWKSLQEIMEEEAAGGQSKKSKPTPQQRQKEANTSVPLPPFQPVAEETVLTAPAPRPNDHFGAYGENGSSTRILQLPPNFKGYVVELARSEAELPPNHPAFKGHSEVFRLLENDGANSYFLANLGPRDAATNFYKKKIKPANKSARLALFSQRGKEYID